jgi:hypothetical protein
MTWQRVEGSHIDPEITEGISSAIADPLWMLARQWQVGEFRGEDAASPVLVDADVVTVPIAEFWIDGTDGRHTITRGDVDGRPLEMLAESEPISTGPASIRIRLESGAALIRSLRLAGAQSATLVAFHDEYPLTDTIEATLDPLGSAQLALLARRVPDAAAVASALATVGGDARQIAPIVPIAEPQKSRLGTAVTTWATDTAAVFCEPGATQPSAWQTPRLEYRFGLSASLADRTIELTASEYPGGTLDWYHFDVTATKPSMESPRGQTRKHLTSLPTPLQYAGMPAPRWWEFEDHDVDFGGLGGGPDDLARSVLASYAMVAGDDWYVVPCDVAAGSLARVQNMVVLDDFGDRTTIASTAANDDLPGRERVWKFFELSDDDGPANRRAPLLLLPPVLHATEHSRPVEQVEFRRDEMANIAWAIERRIESAAGRTIDRNAPRTPPPAPLPVATDDRWYFALSTDVPDHWIPLVPVRIDGTHTQIALRRGRVSTEPDEHTAKGRVLEPEHAFVMHEEEIPAGGLLVERHWQLARDANGKVCLWVGRKRSPGGGPMQRTPLHFDELTGWRG